MTGRVINLAQIQLHRLGKVRHCLVDRLALAGHVNLQALRDIPVLFPVHRSGQDQWLRHDHRLTQGTGSDCHPGPMAWFSAAEAAPVASRRLKSQIKSQRRQAPGDVQRRQAANVAGQSHIERSWATLGVWPGFADTEEVTGFDLALF